MSTRKRVAVILLIYLGASMLYFAVLAIGSSSFFSDPILSRTYTYSLIFPIYCIVCGIFTRLLSCRLLALVISMCANLAQLILSLYKFRWIYKLNYGIQNLGFSYVMVAYALLLIGYGLSCSVIYIVYRARTRKTVANIGNRNHKQHFVNNAMFLKAYNKKSNRNEKYLIWENKSGRIQSSEEIIYYDPVELLAVDAHHRVYTFSDKPTKITVKEYLSQISNCQ